MLAEASLLRQLAQARLVHDLPLSDTAAAELIARISQDLGCDPPAHDSPPEPPDAWLAALPPALQPQAERHWQELRLRQALERCYGDRIEDHFLRRRSGLERVVFRLMRLQDHGLADELYLRLIDDGASFGALAAANALGEERHCRGLVGPLPIHQPHATIRAALAALAPGEVHPPFSLEGQILLLRLEQRLPARLDGATRQQLLEELLEEDLAALLPGCLAAVTGSGDGGAG